MWNFDGVACAAALELGNPVYFFHSNHLLYGYLGFLFWRPLFPWALPRALPALQLFTSILAAGGLAGLFQVLQNVLGDRGLALLLTLCASVSAVVWVWSVEAQVYALGFLAISWATWELLRPDSRWKWVRVGALHVGAVLGHIVHVLWVIPALYWLWKEHPRTPNRPLRHYLTTLGLGILVPYAFVIAFVIVPHQWNDRWLMKWIMGSAALNPNSVFQWHSAGWKGPLEWVFTTPRIFWGSFWPYQTYVPGWCWVLTAISAALIVALFGFSFKQKGQRIWMFSMLWLAVYGVFFWTWEPRTECYRMTDLVPLSILLALGLRAVRPARLQGVVLALILVTLGPLNLRARIVPMHDPVKNVLYQETLSLARRTPENSLYLTAGGSQWIYLLYFTGRSAWDLHAFTRDPHRLDVEIRRHYINRPTYIHARALEFDGTKAWLAGYRLKQVDPSLPWLQLQ